LQAAQPAYNQTKATHFAQYAGAAYCVPQDRSGKVQSWTCGPACNAIPGMNTSTITIIRHEGAIDACGYVGYNYLDNAIIVAFSGTDPFRLRMWLDDIEAKPVDYPNCAGCTVHRGFYDTYLSVQDQVLKAVKSLVAQFPKAVVQVTGHSLGAALSIHGSLDLVLSLGLQVDLLYNFGQPRDGNDAFRQFYQSKVNSYRLTHYKDWVPHEPTYNWGYHNQAYEVYYDEFEKSHKICDSTGEDPTCCDQFPEPYLPLEIVETTIFHLDYVGVSFTEDFLGCKL